MSDVETLVVEKKPNKPFITLLIIWLITVAVLMVVGWNAYFGQKDKTLTLAEQIDAACKQGDLGQNTDSKDLSVGLSPEDEEALCSNAQSVIDENDPEFQDEEIQESEVQEPELQESEIQDPEFQEEEVQTPENQNEESQELENQEAEEQEAEIQDPENQDPEEQDPENQDPEIDDPDPASPYIFTFTFTVPGPGGTEGTTYRVTCDSGTGNCNVEQV